MILYKTHCGFSNPLRHNAVFFDQSLKKVPEIFGCYGRNELCKWCIDPRKKLMFKMRTISNLTRHAFDGLPSCTCFSGIPWPSLGKRCRTVPGSSMETQMMDPESLLSCKRWCSWNNSDLFITDATDGIHAFWQTRNRRRGGKREPTINKKATPTLSGWLQGAMMILLIG